MIAVNTRAAHDAGVARLTSLNAQLESLQGQIATGRRVTLPSDDAIAFGRAAVLRRSAAATEATQRAIDAATGRLEASDVALEGITNLVQRARELALQGANATLNPDDRRVIATEVAELAASFAGLAEARDSDGQRLFGGAAATGPTYAPDANGILTWQGAGPAPAIISGGATIAGGITGPMAFGEGSADLFATFATLGAALAEPDPALRTAAMATAIGEFDSHITRLGDARATAGARLARLQSEDERLERTSLNTSTDLSRLEDLDMTEAIARLQRLLNVLEASQASFVRTTNLSLWDEL